MGDQPLGRCLHRVVHVHDVRRGAEDFAHLLGGGDLAGIVQAVDFRHQRRHHRWAGRYFHHLDVGVVLVPDLLQRATHRQGNLVAFALAMLFVHQVDLNVADVGPGAQVILPDQTVEVDRRGGPGVDLIVGDFLDRGQIAAQFAQHPHSLLQRRPFRHVHDYLKFRFVVERQHFQHDELKIRQADRTSDQQQYADAEHPAQWSAFPPAQERPDHAPEQAMGEIFPPVMFPSLTKEGWRVSAGVVGGL